MLQIIFETNTIIGGGSEGWIFQLAAGTDDVLEVFVSVCDEVTDASSNCSTTPEFMAIAPIQRIMNNMKPRCTILVRAQKWTNLNRLGTCKIYKY